MNRLRVLTWSLLVMLSGSSAFGMKSFNDYGPTYFEPSESVVTPHIRWARPLAGGPLKVLFITNHKSTRDIVEIAQRLEMDYEVFTTELPQVFAAPNIPVDHSRPDDYEERLRAKLDPARGYDVIVVANVHWDILPQWSRDAILERVEAGTGFLSLVEGGLDSDWLKLHATPKPVSATAAFSPFPYLALPEYASSPATSGKEAPQFMSRIIDTFEYGQGRVVRIKGIQPPTRQMITPGYVGGTLDVSMLHYDYHLTLPMRLMLWAGQRTAAVRVRAVTPWRWCHTDDSQFDRDKLPPIAFRLEADKPGDVHLEIIVRNHHNDVLHADDRAVTLAAGDNIVRFDRARLPAGVHFADMWIRDAAREAVIDFGSLSVDVRSATHLRELILADDHFKNDDPVTGHVVVVAPTGDEKLVVDRYDNWGRHTGRSRVPVERAPDSSTLVAFDVGAADTRSVRQVLSVKLVRGDDLVDEVRKAFSISDLYAASDIRSFLFTSDNGNCYTDILFMREVARAGFDTVISNPDTKRMAVLASRANLHRTTSDYGPGSAVAATQTDAGPVRFACLTDPQTIEQTERGARALGERLGRFSNRTISLASEGGYIRGHTDEANACFSPTCLASFHAWLEQAYGTLDALNAEYETDYAAWNEVIPVSLTRARSKPNLLPLWVDHRRHMESVWAGFFTTNTRAFRSVIPTARVGYQCSGSIGHGANSYAAVDYWAMNQAMTLNCNYPGPFAPEAARDFIQDGAIIGNDCWGGYEFGRNVRSVQWAPWRSLLRGANTFLIFRALGHTRGSGVNTGNEMACLAPDLSWYPYMDAGNSEIREIKRGIGKLLMESRRDHDGIAVMYSAPSTHVSTFTDGLPAYGSTLQAFPYLFEDAGYQYRTVSYQQVAEGVLRDGEFRVLYLPYCQAISRAEAAEISDFVQAGGTVIADLRPGVTNEHGKAYETGVLDEVFGVRQDTANAAPRFGMVTVDVPIGGLRGRLIPTHSDGSLQVTTGRAHGDSAAPPLLRRTTPTDPCPTVVINNHGKGRAILLNLAISEYGAEAGYSARANELLTSLLSSVEVLPRVTITPDIPGTQVYRYRQGDAIYAGLLRNPPGKDSPGHDHGERDIENFEPVEFTVGLPHTSHLYNMRTGEYLGQRDHMQHTEGGVTAFMLAALPYAVRDIDLTIPSRSAVQLGQTVTVQARVRTEGDAPVGLHVLHVELMDPNGEPVAWYRSNVVAEDGGCTLEVPFALNAPMGEWRLLVRDAATGVARHLELELTDGK